jgi:hypothetical protein
VVSVQIYRRRFLAGLRRAGPALACPASNTFPVILVLSRASPGPYASSSFTTLPATSVSRKSRPWKRKVSLV